MKKLIGRIGIFIGIISAMMLIMVIATIAIMSQASFQMDSNKNILVLGDSQTEGGIDDNVFKRTVNLSQNGTAYLYSYSKLKKVLENNQHIDTVLLSFSYTSLMQEIEDKWIMREDFLVPKVISHLSLLGKDEFLVYKDKKTLLQAILKAPIRNANKVINYFLKGKSNFSYQDLKIGAYRKDDRQDLQKDLDEKWSYKVPPSENESPVQKEYLLKIANYCKEHHVKLILLSMPTYRSEQYDTAGKLHEYHSKYLNEIEFLDFSNFPMPDESYYGDAIHLNYKGAEFFSNYLQDNLGL